MCSFVAGPLMLLCAMYVFTLFAGPNMMPLLAGDTTLSTGVIGGDGGGVQVQDFGAKPALVSLYAKTAAAAFEPAFKTTGEVSYETSLAQVLCSVKSARVGRDWAYV